MTLTDLFTSTNADALEKLSEAELDAILSPYFNVTRPEFAVKHERRISISKPRTPEELEKQQKKQIALDKISKISGIDQGLLEFLKKKI